MSIDEFVKAFAAEFEDTPEELFSSETIFKDLEEWGSLIALSIISMIDDAFDKTITGADLRSCDTIKELYDLVEAK